MGSAAVIPAFNEGETIGKVVRDALKFVDHVVVVDDGSKDDTSIEASRNGAEVIRLEKNSGKANATRVGLGRCKGYDVVVTMDGDLQHSPSEIPSLIRCVEDGADLCVGSRFLKGDVEMPLANRISNKIARRVISFLARRRLTDPQSGFRAINGAKVGDLELKAERYAIEHIMILEVARRGFVIREVPVSCRYGGERSHINAIRDTLRVIYDLARAFL
ncbi:MAG: glycosyltransferase family 2 protein [Candidatus Hydrothermarchaeales archaeon]